MGFVLGVLVVGALLSTIFGKRVGAMFVTGTATVVGVLFAVLLVLLSPLIWDYLNEPSNVRGASRSFSPSQSADSSYSSPQPAPQTQTVSQAQPTYQTTEATGTSGVGSGAAYAPPPLPPPATGTGPRIGVNLADVPAYTVQQLTYLHVPPGAGTWVSVQPGSPAEVAGLKTYDVILSAGTQTQPADWITLSNQLPDYLDRVGYNVPVRLHVYRASEQRDFWTWVHPR